MRLANGIVIDKEATFSLTFFDKSYKSALKYMGAVSGRNEDKIGNAKMHVDYYKDEVPYIDEGNLVIVCRKMSATRITEDQFIDPEIKEKWYEKNKDTCVLHHIDD